MVGRDCWVRFVRVSPLLVSLTASACGSDDPVRGEHADGDQLEEVRVIRGAANTSDWGGLTILGEGLHEHDGKIVTVRVGYPDRPPERLGAGQVRIVDGTFAISLPGVAETTVYKRRAAFIDVDADGHCDASADLVFADYRAAADLVLTLSSVEVSLETFTEFMLTESLIPEKECEELFNIEWPVE